MEILKVIPKEEYFIVWNLIEKDLKYVIDDFTNHVQYIFTFENGKIHYEKDNILSGKELQKSNLDIRYEIVKDSISKIYKLDESNMIMVFKMLNNVSFTINDFIKVYNALSEGTMDKIYKSSLFTRSNTRSTYANIYYITPDMYDSIRFIYRNSIILKRFKNARDISSGIFYGFIDGIYTKMTTEEAKKHKLISICKRFFDDTVYVSYEEKFYFEYKNQCVLSLNTNIVRHTVKHRMHLGQTIDDFIKEYNASISSRLWSFNGYSLLDRVVGKIERPKFCRFPENENPKTFDFIRLNVRLSYLGGYKTIHEKSEFLKPYIPTIHEMVLDKLKNDKSFISKDIPIYFLKVSKCTITADDRLEYILELKDEVVNALTFEK